MTAPAHRRSGGEIADMVEPLGDLVTRLTKIDLELEEISTERSALRSRIAEQLHPGQRWAGDDGLGVLLTEGALSFDPVRALRVLYPEELRLILLTAPNRELAKKHLPLERFEECCTRGTPVLRTWRPT